MYNNNGKFVFIFIYYMCIYIHKVTIQGKCMYVCVHMCIYTYTHKYVTYLEIQVTTNSF